MPPTTIRAVQMPVLLNAAPLDDAKPLPTLVVCVDRQPRAHAMPGRDGLAEHRTGVVGHFGRHPTNFAALVNENIANPTGMQTVTNRKA